MPSPRTPSPSRRGGSAPSTCCSSCSPSSSSRSGGTGCPGRFLLLALLGLHEHLRRVGARPTERPCRVPDCGGGALLLHDLRRDVIAPQHVRQMHSHALGTLPSRVAPRAALHADRLGLLWAFTRLRKKGSRAGKERETIFAGRARGGRGGRGRRHDLSLSLTKQRKGALNLPPPFSRQSISRFVLFPPPTLQSQSRAGCSLARSHLVPPRAAFGTRHLIHICRACRFSSLEDALLSSGI